MRVFLATTCIVTGVMLTAGCATKKYVRNTAAPIQAKVDQVGEQEYKPSQRSVGPSTTCAKVDKAVADAYRPASQDPDFSV